MIRYKKLMDLAGISGFEHQVRSFMEEEIKKNNNFEIVKDNLGSIFGFKKSKTENTFNVVVAGHMDEVGLMVTKITKEGFLKLSPIGGLLGETFISQIMNVYTDNGVVKGVIGSLPPHFKKSQKANIEDLLLDIGAESKEDAISYGVKLGDMVLFDNHYVETNNPNRIISKAVDNRFGCGLALDMIDKYNDIDLPYNLYIGATVQEEVGLRGAETSANMLNPDLFIALDASPVNELDPNSLGALGKGFLIRMHDPRNIMDQGLLKYFEELATKNNILHQHFISKGGTDAAKVLDINKGVLSTTIGLPSRYIHSTAAMMDVRDLDAARNFLDALLKDITLEKINDLKFNKKN